MKESEEVGKEGNRKQSKARIEKTKSLHQTSKINEQKRVTLVRNTENRDH